MSFPNSATSDRHSYKTRAIFNEACNQRGTTRTSSGLVNRFLALDRTTTYAPTSAGSRTKTGSFQLRRAASLPFPPSFSFASFLHCGGAAAAAEVGSGAVTAVLIALPTRVEAASRKTQFSHPTDHPTTAAHARKSAEPFKLHLAASISCGEGRETTSPTLPLIFDKQQHMQFYAPLHSHNNPTER